jgi:hemolysin III
VTEARTAEKPVPRLRGVSHAVAFFLAAAATLRAVALAPPRRATVAVAVHTIRLVPLFGGIAPYHRWPVPGRFKAILKRLDHSNIFVFIAASYTPIALVVWVLPSAGA